MIIVLIMKRGSTNKYQNSNIRGTRSTLMDEIMEVISTPHLKSDKKEVEDLLQRVKNYMDQLSSSHNYHECFILSSRCLEILVKYALYYLDTVLCSLID